MIIKQIGVIYKCNTLYRIVNEDFSTDSVLNKIFPWREKLKTILQLKMTKMTQINILLVTDYQKVDQNSGILNGILIYFEILETLRSLDHTLKFNDIPIKHSLITHWLKISKNVKLQFGFKKYTNIQYLHKFYN